MVVVTMSSLEGTFKNLSKQQTVTGLTTLIMTIKMTSLMMNKMITAMTKITIMVMIVIITYQTN